MCTLCNKAFSRIDNLQKHKRNCNRRRGSLQSGSGLKRTFTFENSNMVLNKKSKFSNEGFKIETVKTAFKKAAITWTIKYGKHEEEDIINLIDASIFTVESNLLKYRGTKNALKFIMTLHAMFEKTADSTILTDPPVCSVSEPIEVYPDTDVKECLDNVYKQLLNYIDVYERNGFGWVLTELKELDNTVWQHDPLRASSYYSVDC